MGEIVTRGKIKVDARKALHKLRDHMLVDLHLWATEIARVAVTLGATWLEVGWDTDDVILTFDGRTLPPEAIAGVRDHVLSPREDRSSDDKDALRLLGIGVTAALGLAPSFVDVYSSGKRVRFGAAYIDDESSAPPAATDAERDAPKEGTRVHVRKKLGIELLGRAVKGEIPREVSLLVAASVDAPFTLRGKGLPKDVATRAPAAILRVDLDVPEATTAVLEVLAPTPGWRSERVFLERGIRLAAYAGVDAWGLDDAELPLRVLVDARRLPTNASRSELRADADLVKRVKERIPRALEIAVDALQHRPKAQATKLGHAVEVRDARPFALHDALGAIAASAALASRSGHDIPDVARKLLDLPLMQDAIGEPLTLANVVQLMTRPPVLVFRGDAPEHRMLAPWLSGMPWVKGAPVERLLHAEPMMEADAVVAEARAGGARRARALAHPPSRPVLVRTPQQILVESFSVTEGRFAGLEGEVAITKREGEFRRGANVHVFVEERMIEVVPLPGTALPLEMALAWPARFRPRRAYDGVERNESIEEAVHYALRVAAIAIGERLGKGDPELVRLAIVAWVGATARLQDIAPSIEALGALASEAAWPTSEPGVHASLVILDTYARRTGALCIAPSGSGRAADGRPVLDEAHLAAMRDLLPEKTAVVPYARALAVPPGQPLEWIGRVASRMFAYVQITRPHVAGILGIGGGDDALQHRRYHRGFIVREDAHFAGASLVVEDLGAVPNEKYTGALYVTPIEDVEREEHALVQIVVERCERGELDTALVEKYLEDTADDVKSRDPALYARIVEVPKAAARSRAALRKAAFSAQPLDGTPRPAGPSGSITALGVGTVTAIVPDAAALESWRPPPAFVLYGGRALTTIPTKLPVVAFVELLRQEHVADDWASLSETGLDWANGAIASAAVELVKDAARRAEFANDVGVMRLAAELLDGSPTLASKIDHALRKVKWPAVQGGTWSIGEAGERVTVHTGQRAFASWLRDETASPFDAPAVCLPQDVAGELRSRILRALGCELVDVTETLARIQEQRARWAKNPPPRLPGTPEFPRLRSMLSALGITCAEGELEIIAASKPEVTRMVTAGVAAPFEVGTQVPIRAVFRCADGDVARAAQEIASAAEKHVRTLARTMNPLPAVARAAARVLLTAEIASGRDAGDLERLPLFPDTSGQVSLTFAEMRNADTTRIVTDPPPHPKIEGGSPVVFLWPAEKDALSGVVRFTDLTASVREIALGDQRRAAPPIAEAALDEETHRACLLVVTVDAGSLTGEVGLLAPAHVALRGIRLHHTMRPLMTLPDDGGWPMVAVVNDDSIVPTRAFTGIASRDDAARIRADLRSAVLPRVETLFELPADALGTIRLPFPFFAQPGRVPCIGALWIERTWPERPEVHVEAPGHVDPFHVPRSNEGALSDIVPIKGKVLVACAQHERDAALRDVFRHAKKRLGSVVAAAKRAPDAPPGEVISAYEWDLRLLGERTDRDPRAELDADRPDELLLRVVARRAPHLLQIEESPPPPLPVSSALETTNVEDTIKDTQLPSFDFAPASSPPSFFQGLVRRIAELVSGPEPTMNAALTNALTDAILAMKLTGTPVGSVVEARRGRPVRFDRETKRLFVNTRHAAVRALDGDPSRTLYLLAAAVSEVNRELEQVTDAEELNVVADLLRG